MSYWTDRAALRQAVYDRSSAEVGGIITDAHKRMLSDLREDARRIIGNFEKAFDLTPTEARQLLKSPLPAKEAERLRERIDLITDPAYKKLMQAKVSSGAYAHRLNRLEGIQMSAETAAIRVADVEKTIGMQHLEDTIYQGYGRTMFDVQKYTGIAFRFDGVDERRVKQILRNQWSGKSFSRRVWLNNEEMARQLSRALVERVMQGKTTRETFQALSDLSDMGRMAANRLLSTETNYIANQATAEAYEDAGIERYKYIAVLDGRTSHVCFVGSDKVQTLSGVEKVFRRPYSGDIITITTASKKQISGTPNHPVLTANGWLPLYEVEPSKQVLYSVLNEFTFIPRNQNVYMPTCISEVCDSVSKVTAFEVLSAGSSTTQFDGDGDFINNKVDAVNAESVLRDCAYSGRVKHVVKHLLCTAKRRGFLAALSRFCKLFDCGEVVLVTPELKVIVPDDRVKPIFTSRKLFHDFGWAKTLIKESNGPLSVKLRLLVALAALVILKEPVIFEKSSGGGHAGRILLCNYSGGNTIPILEEYVVSKRVKYRTCHVYNLQTSDSTYLNDTIIVHNCQELDGKEFELSQAVVGVNMSPMHPWCRSTISPVVPGFVREGMKRWARDPETGKQMYVDANMTYKQWIETIKPREGTSALKSKLSKALKGSNR